MTVRTTQPMQSTQSGPMQPRRDIINPDGSTTHVPVPGAQQQWISPEESGRLVAITPELEAVEMALADGQLSLREAALLRARDLDPKLVERELRFQGGEQAIQSYQKAREMFAAIDAAWANGAFDGDEVAHLRALGDKLGYTNKQLAGAIKTLHGPTAGMEFNANGRLPGPMPPPLLPPEEPWRPVPLPRNPRYPMPGPSAPRFPWQSGGPRELTPHQKTPVDVTATKKEE